MSGATVATTAERRRRRPEARREEILQAAVRLFAERGYGRTTTREIARAAGISEGTIYTYFGSKQDLLFSFIEEAAVHPLSSLMASVERAGDEEVFRTFLRDRFEVWQRNLPLLKVVFSEALFNRDLARALYTRVVGPATEYLRRFVSQRVCEGSYRPVNPDLAVSAFAGNLFTFNLLWGELFREHAEPLSREETINTLVTLFLSGIRAGDPEDPPPSPAPEAVTESRPASGTEGGLR